MEGNGGEGLSIFHLSFQKPGVIQACIYIRDVPDTDFVGYPATGYPAHWSSRIPDIRLALHDIRPDTGFQKRPDIRPVGYPVHPLILYNILPPQFTN